jgi:hypothetical protein
MYPAVWETFRRLLMRAGLKPGSASSHGPRMHDFRHYAAFRTMPSKLSGPLRLCLFQ